MIRCKASCLWLCMRWRGCGCRPSLRPAAASFLFTTLIVFTASSVCVQAFSPRARGMPSLEVSEDVIERAVGKGWKSTSSSVLAELWAGYGLVYGLELSKSGSEKTRVVVKKVAAPQGGASDDEGHARKLRSYEVEAAFYRDCVPRILASNPPVALPRPHLVDGQGGDLTLVMSDLRETFPLDGGAGLNAHQMSAAIRFLAHFHASNWEAPLHPQLWPQGGYWRLETRRKEWGRMGREWARLQAAATALDHRVRGLSPAGAGAGAAGAGAAGAGAQEVQGRHRSVVHGDCKSDNLALSGKGERAECAGYDFQYCGGGYSSTDLVQLFVSSGSRMSDAQEHTYLQLYFSALSDALALAGKPNTLTLEQLSRQYEICLLDYVRFLAGWGFWGDVAYAKRRASALLDQLDGGTVQSEAEYFTAVYSHYPLASE